MAEGIELPDTICNQLQEEADRFAVSLGEEIVEAGDGERYASGI